MCLGAVPWSGVHRLVCGARTEDAAAIGFEEGDRMPDWVQRLEQRGVEVIREVKRAEGAKVLEDYARSGGVIYNGRAAG
jgi:tRNA(Arg) A34 adenosine deaminase TadA